MRPNRRQSTRLRGARRSHAALALLQTFCYWRCRRAGASRTKKKRKVAPHRPEGKRNAPSAPRGRAVHRPYNRLEPGWPRAQPGRSSRRPASCSTACCTASTSPWWSRRSRRPSRRTSCWRRCSSRPAISRSPSTTCSRCARSARTMCRTASPRSAGSPAIRSGTMSAPRVFTGGAVRYRVYSAWGLTAIDVAKICFIAGLTFWLGNATVLGLGIAYEPQAASAIDQLPPWFNRIIAFVALGVLAGYVAWVWAKPRVIGRADWTVTASRRPADAAADRDRHHRSRLLRARHVRAAAGRPAHRLHQARGDLRLGDAARLRQPLARRARRVRRRDAGRADRVQQGRAARRAPAVPAALLCHPVRVVARDPRRARVVARACAGK